MPFGQTLQYDIQKHLRKSSENHDLLLLLISLLALLVCLFIFYLLTQVPPVGLELRASDPFPARRACAVNGRWLHPTPTKVTLEPNNKVNYQLQLNIQSTIMLRVCSLTRCRVPQGTLRWRPQGLISVPGASATSLLQQLQWAEQSVRMEGGLRKPCFVLHRLG